MTASRLRACGIQDPVPVSAERRYRQAVNRKPEHPAQRDLAGWQVCRRQRGQPDLGGWSEVQMRRLDVGCAVRVPVVSDDLAVVQIREAVLVSSDACIPEATRRVGLLDAQAEPHPKVYPPGSTQPRRISRVQDYVEKIARRPILVARIS